jgi:NADPH2:quinone reductase
MKAIRVHAFGDPDVMRLEEVAEPAPGAGEVLVRIHAAGVNPVDAYIRTGAYAAKPALPYTPGVDGAGVIAATGDGVADLSPGDRVYFSGTAEARMAGAYAQAAVCRRRQVHALPDRISFAQGAALGVPYVTAYRALVMRAEAQPGECALVHGASGAVGVAAVQIARQLRLTVIGSAGGPDGVALVREQGAHHVVNHREAGYEERIREATGRRGVDVVIEMLANVNLDRDLGLLAPRGRVVVVGNRGRTEIDARQTMAKDSSILGMSFWNIGPDELDQIHSALAEGLAGGWLTPVVGRELPLASAAEAHRAVFEPGARGKIVLRCE